MPASLKLNSGGAGNVILTPSGSVGSDVTLTIPASTGTIATLTTPSFATTIAVGGATPSASGSGITFPATQSATSDANTLDDYEEGSWTPTQGAGLTVVGSFSSWGRYTKIGNLVYVMGRVNGSTSVAVATAGGIVCGGLPFTQPSPNNQVGNGIGVNEAANASLTVSAYGTSLYAQGTMSATTNIYFSVVYTTNT